MDMINFVMKMAVGGSNWILVLLILLSFTSLAFIIERYIFFRKWEKDTKKLWAVFNGHVCSNNIENLKKNLEREQIDSPLSNLLFVALDNLCVAKGKLESLLEAEKVMLKLALDKRLPFLGTLGSNAPFIGLFGTVLGIVHAFKVLGTTGQGGSNIMAAIAEALIATALGLFVAIPSTIAFNYFKKKESDLLHYADAISHLMMGEVKDEKA